MLQRMLNLLIKDKEGLKNNASSTVEATVKLRRLREHISKIKCEIEAYGEAEK
jgi:hypothetical protein